MLLNRDSNTTTNYTNINLKTKRYEKAKINKITEGSTNIFYITSIVLLCYMDNST